MDGRVPKLTNLHGGGGGGGGQRVLRSFRAYSLRLEKKKNNIHTLFSLD